MIEVLKFSSATCAPCKVLSNTLEGVEGITEVIDREVFAKYGIRRVPTLIFLKDGVEVQRVGGSIPLVEYERILNELN
jgi:thioredoxin 1